MPLTMKAAHIDLTVMAGPGTGDIKYQYRLVITFLPGLNIITCLHLQYSVITIQILAS